MSAHDERGELYRVEFKEHKIEKIASNGGSFCYRVHSLTNYSDHAIALSDTGDCKVKVINPVTRNVLCWLVTDRARGMEARHSSLSQQEYVLT